MDAVVAEEKKYTWWFVTSFNGGHRVWFDRKSRKYSIADESGDFAFRYGKPSDTDDGVLWFDLSRPIVTDDAEAWATHSKIPILNIEASVPVTNEHGHESFFRCEGDELAWLAIHFRWLIKWGERGGYGRVSDGAWVDLGYPKEPRLRRQPEPLNFCHKRIIKE